MPNTSSRAPEAPRKPLAPARCDECRHGWELGRVCTLQPLSGEWPGVKPHGCLYYERRGRDGER